MTRVFTLLLCYILVMETNAAWSPDFNKFPELLNDGISETVRTPEEVYTWANTEERNLRSRIGNKTKITSCILCRDSLAVSKGHFRYSRNAAVDFFMSYVRAGCKKTFAALHVKFQGALADMIPGDPCDDLMKNADEIFDRTSGLDFGQVDKLIDEDLVCVQTGICKPVETVKTLPGVRVNNKKIKKEYDLRAQEEEARRNATLEAERLQAEEDAIWYNRIKNFFKSFSKSYGIAKLFGSQCGNCKICFAIRLPANFYCFVLLYYHHGFVLNVYVLKI